MTRDRFIEAAQKFAPRPADIGGIKCMIRPMTMAAMGRIRAASRAGDEVGAGLEAIKSRICDVDGKPMFTDADDDMLRQWPAEFFAQMMDAVNGEDAPDAETAEGN